MNERLQKSRKIEHKLLNFVKMELNKTHERKQTYALFLFYLKTYRLHGGSENNVKNQLSFMIYAKPFYLQLQHRTVLFL